MRRFQVKIEWNFICWLLINNNWAWIRERKKRAIKSNQNRAIHEEKTFHLGSFFLRGLWVSSSIYTFMEQHFAIGMWKIILAMKCWAQSSQLDAHHDVWWNHLISVESFEVKVSNSVKTYSKLIMKSH